MPTWSTIVRRPTPRPPPSEGVTVVEVLEPGATRPSTTVVAMSLDEALRMVRGWP